MNYTPVDFFTLYGHLVPLNIYAEVEEPRVDLTIKDREEIIGNHTKVKVVKNKVAAPFKTVEFDIMYGEGISKTGELIDLGVSSDIVEKSGAWYSYNTQRIGQGRENAKSFLKEHPEIANEIELALKKEANISDEINHEIEKTNDT